LSTLEPPLFHAGDRAKGLTNTGDLCVLFGA